MRHIQQLFFPTGLLLLLLLLSAAMLFASCSSGPQPAAGGSAAAALGRPDAFLTSGASGASAAPEPGSLAELFAGHARAYREKVLGERMHAPIGLAQFYRERGYAEAWSAADDGSAFELLSEIRLKQQEGFDPDDFHARAISTVLEDLRRRRSLKLETPRRTFSELDLLCTDAFLALANQLQTGRVGLKSQGHDELPARDDVEPPGRALSRALESRRIAGSLEDMTPKSEQYQGLVKALVLYRAFAAGHGWPLVPPGPKISPGGHDSRLPVLRRRLALEGYLKGRPAKGSLYDDDAVAALKVFQQTHGLLANGALDRATLGELNVSARRRARQLEANLERWRWLPRELGARHVEVNIPAYELRAVRDKQTVERMAVVVGNLYRQTPVFWSRISSVVLNPSWYVPRSILIQDILPKARKNADFLETEGFHAFRAVKGHSVDVELSEIDWSAIDDPDEVDFQLREESAPANPLGRVKFVFANPFSVFLHDSPKRELFRRNSRAYSSGCIRLSKPLDLLAFVLEGQPEWDGGRVAQLVTSLGRSPSADEAEPAKSDETVSLGAPVPIYLLYQTAWLEEPAGGETRVQFRRDIYGQDESLVEQL